MLLLSTDPRPPRRYGGVCSTAWCRVNSRPVKKACGAVVTSEQTHGADGV